MSGSAYNKFVIPFYLPLMAANAVNVDQELWDRLVGVGRTVEPDVAEWLLRDGDWRAAVMGAWFGLRFDTEGVRGRVLGLLARSAGSLNALPLATAAVLHSGIEAADALRTSTAREDALSRGILDAALELLGEDPVEAVRQHDRNTFAGLLAFGTKLREGLTASA